jgi:hypothetical protein
MMPAARAGRDGFEQRDHHQVQLLLGDAQQAHLLCSSSTSSRSDTVSVCEMM